MALRPGSTLGHYEVLSNLGAGGMGEVYRALDTRLRREVAIKVLPDAVSAEPDRLARFDREAKALAALSHPNVATLHGIEQAMLEGRGVPFLVMELVEGPTLAERIARGAMGWREAAPVFLAIARGLEAAHERGIVHRDLKPANVKVRVDDASGEVAVKVLDFGLAKTMAREAASGAAAALEDSPTATMAATMRGEVLGTLGYMAPEQARGVAVDKRADVWAFGVCLFEALTGRRVFGGDTLSDRLAAVLKEEPDWDLLPDDVPRPLVDLLGRCLVKPAADRLRDIGEARRARRTGRESRRAGASRVRRTRGSGRTRAGVAPRHRRGAGCGGPRIGYRHLARHPRPNRAWRDRSRGRTDPVRHRGGPVALDVERGEAIGVVMSLLGNGARNVDLVVGSLDGETPARELVSGRVAGSGAGPTGARLSPHGDRLAYALLTDPVAQIATLYVAEYPGMVRRFPISETGDDNGYAWGPDGRLWYTEQRDNTMRVASFAEGDALEVSSIDVAFSDVGRFSPERGFAVAPDGRLLMVRTAREVGGQSGRVHVVVGWAREEGLLPP